jgi:hypothetical protein
MKGAINWAMHTVMSIITGEPDFSISLSLSVKGGFCPYQKLASAVYIFLDLSAHQNMVSVDCRDSQTGCILKSHKSPTCLASFCRRAIDHLREQFGIYFCDCLGICCGLEWILTGSLPEAEYLELKRNLSEATKKINESEGPLKIETAAR